MADDVIKFDEAYMWIENGGSIHLKAVSPHGDPIELTPHEARDIARALLRLADELDALDQEHSGS
jgi:hypothetical protein